MGYAIRLPANRALQDKIGYLLMAEVAVPRQMFQEILSLIARLRVPPAPA